jgi:predicted aminopeptidase
VPKASFQLVVACISGISLSVCSTLGLAAQANTGGVPAMYATKAEAEAAAKQHFKCTGAHQMGNQWMPCATHGQANDNNQPKH